MRLFKHPLSLRKTGETLFPTTEVSQGRVIPLLAGARVFPEAQPREWAAPADSSSEGLGNNSENKGYDFWVSSHFVQGFHPDNGRR